MSSIQSTPYPRPNLNVSFPRPPKRRSACAPPSRVSSPSPPLRKSTPHKPTNLSAAPVPERLSCPLVPRMTFLADEPTFTVTVWLIRSDFWSVSTYSKLATPVNPGAASNSTNPSDRRLTEPLTAPPTETTSRASPSPSTSFASRVSRATTRVSACSMS